MSLSRIPEEAREIQDRYYSKFGKHMCYCYGYKEDIFVKTLEEAIQTGKPVNVKKMEKSMNIKYEDGIDS